MIKAATKRSILRWIHLIFAIPILGYIYSPFAELPSYATIYSVCLRSVRHPRGILDVCRPSLRYHWRCGLARCISPLWDWGGSPESGRAIHRAKDLVVDSRAALKVIAPARTYGWVRSDRHISDGGPQA